MAAINFPAASESPWYNPENGITYEYIGGTWRSVNQLSDAFDSKYVEVSGDNMTGDLTIGSGDKITLDATDGSAEFAGGASKILGSGSITVGSVSSAETENGVLLSNGNGSATAYKEPFDFTSNIFGTSTAAFQTVCKDENEPGNRYVTGQWRGDGSLRIGNLSDSVTQNILLDARDGSATFAGTVQAGNIDIDSDNNLGIKNFVGTTASVLQIQGKPATATSQEAIQVFRGSTSTWSVNYGGTASFSNAIFNLEPDNPANYVSTTDADGNQTQVYNGPTLDVKAVIQDLQQRVADRDTVIADLTTRIQALEANY